MKDDRARVRSPTESLLLRHHKGAACFSKCSWNASMSSMRSLAHEPLPSTLNPKDWAITARICSRDVLVMLLDVASLKGLRNRSSVFRVKGVVGVRVG